MSQKHITRYGLWVFFLWIAPTISEAQQTDKLPKGDRITKISNAPTVDTLDLGYRKMSMDDFNGAAYTISTKDLENIPATNLSNLLSGLIPGFFSVQSSGGTVNEAANYRIRGIRTSSEGVLVLVDGQERDFGILSTKEVASITVLKDASLEVLYGTRAANGIILVNTKKGTIGKPTVEFSSQFINQEAIGILQPVDGLTYATNYNQALRNDGRASSTLYSNYYLQQYRNREGVNAEQYPDVNWLEDYYKKNSLVQRYNLNISGGSEHTRYFVNGTYLQQGGMFKSPTGTASNNSTNRFNLRSNLEVDVTSTTVLNLDLYGWNDKQDRPGNDSFGLYSNLVTIPANSFPAFYTSNGSYIDQEGALVKGVDGQIVAGNALNNNPYASITRNGYGRLNRIYGSFRAKLTQDLSFITKGLNVSGTLSLDGYSASVINRTKAFAYYTRPDFTTNNLIRTGNDDKQVNTVPGADVSSQTRSSLDFQFSYGRSFGKSNISATTFYNQYELDDQTSIPSRFQTIGYWAGYNFDHKYYVDFTGSYQGVYKFAPGHRFGFFPAVTAGWAVSNEKFFAPLTKFVSYFKLRGSYGLVGSQRGVSEFVYRSRLNSTTGIYWFGNTQTAVGGYIEDIVADPGLTWEKSKQLNIGANVRFLNNRLSYVVDYFKDTRTDQYMVNNNISGLYGTVATISQNIGEMYSNGIEMALSWNAAVGKVGYRLGATYSVSQNKIQKTGEVNEQYPWLMSAGYSRGIRTGYESLGLFQSYDEIAASPRQTFSQVKPGDIKYRDVNQDGLIDRNDVVPLDYGGIPSEFFGVNGGLSYKNVGFSFLFQGAARVTQNLSGRVAYPFLSNGTMYENQLDYWTPENPNASLPRISTVNTNTNNAVTSSFWIKNTSYVRLKTVELYYELPEKMLKKVFFNNVRIYASGYNLFEWSKGGSPLDPEDSGNSNNMPLTRNISLGLTARF